MTDQAQHEAPTILVIPQPAVRQAIAMTTVAIFLALFAILPYKLGFERFFESLAYFSATWLVMCMFAPAIAFFAWLAFPPRGSLPRLEVSRSRIRVVPGLIARRFAETAVEINLYPTSRDILLCHSVWKGLGDGLRLVVRDGDGTERQIRATSIDYLTARKAQKLAQGISDITGLPVQLLTRIRQADGRVQEISWNPPSGWTRVFRGAALATGAAPFVGGAIVGILWPSPAVMLAVGLGLWLSQMSFLVLLARCTGSKAKFPTLYSLTTVFTFAATYAVAVVVVHFMFKGR
jgi:hypothetical protein